MNKIDNEYNFISEDMTFGGSELYMDLIPRFC